MRDGDKQELLKLIQNEIDFGFTLLDTLLSHRVTTIRSKHYETPKLRRKPQPSF